jgi:hypothetical protein
LKQHEILSSEKSQEPHPFRRHSLHRNPIADGASTPGLDSLQVIAGETLATQAEDCAR